MNANTRKKKGFSIGDRVFVARSAPNFLIGSSVVVLDVAEGRFRVASPASPETSGWFYAEDLAVVNPVSDTHAPNAFNGLQVEHRGGCIFIPLPRESWTPAGPCRCPECKGAESFWDTMAVSTDPKAKQTSWTVHHPAQHKHERALMRQDAVKRASELGRELLKLNPRAATFNALVSYLTPTHGPLAAAAEADDILGPVPS